MTISGAVTARYVADMLAERERLTGGAPPAIASDLRALAPPARFDRERIVLDVSSVLVLGLVTIFYVAGYLLPAIGYAKAIVGAAEADSRFPAGCYLLFMEHANRLQSIYALRFLAMMMGIAVAFMGMLFTIKGLEAGYAIDLRNAAQSASLKTASPGLVLCTFGAVLVLAAVLHSSDLTFMNSEHCLR
jgi:hypothetical protein